MIYSRWQKRYSGNLKSNGFLVVFLLLFLVACGSEEESTESPTGSNDYDMPRTACNASVESSMNVVKPYVTNIAARANHGDPLYDNQWHLEQAGGAVGGDINVIPVWEQGIKGNGVMVAVVDDGLEINHEDLADNIKPGKSINYLDNGRAPDDPTPLPGSKNYHGTAVAGVIAARDYNEAGGRGAAPRASLVGYNMLQLSTFSNAADAMVANKQFVAVSNNSWSFAADDTGELVASNSLWRSAILDGVKNGRNGRGINYVFAAGNGGENGVDNSNYDGYVNNRYVLAVCSVGDDGKRAYYSEKGANLWVCAPSLGNSGMGITTTDLSGNEGLNPASDSNDYRNKNYTYRFGGTSSSAPLVSGVIALMLEKNPALGWRDVRMILARSAAKNDPADPDWIVSPGDYPYNINHKYGFGTVDATAAVAMAESWNLLAGEEILETEPSRVDGLIPDNDSIGFIDRINIDENYTIEYVDVIVDIEHADIGDLTIGLTSPMGVKSILAKTHDCQNECGVVTQCRSSFDNWSFGVARNLGESSQGGWQLSVVDKKPGVEGRVKSWRLKIYGIPK